MKSASEKAGEVFARALRSLDGAIGALGAVHAHMHKVDAPPIREQLARHLEDLAKLRLDFEHYIRMGEVSASQRGDK